MPMPSHRRVITGRELRWVLTDYLFGARVMSLRALVDALEADGFLVSGRPSKVVSDALRWEVRRGRVVRLGRGKYAAGSMPKQTLSWRRARVRAIRAERCVSEPWRAA